MYFSAKASNSIVRIPGSTALLKASRQPAKISPARAILSISAGDLGMITPPSSRWPDSLLNIPIHITRPTLTIHPNENTLVLVVSDQGFSLLPVHTETVLHGLFRIIISLLEFPAAGITHTFLRRRIEDHVKRSLAVLAYTSAGQSAHQLIILDHYGWSFAHSASDVFKSLIQSLSLRDGPRKAVHQEPARGIRLLQPILDYPYGHGVRHKLSGIHILLGFQAHLRPVPDCTSQYVSGGYVRNPILLDYPYGHGVRHKLSGIHILLGFQAHLRPVPDCTSQYVSGGYVRNPILLHYT